MTVYQMQHLYKILIGAVLQHVPVYKMSMLYHLSVEGCKLRNGGQNDISQIHVSYKAQKTQHLSIQIFFWTILWKNVGFKWNKVLVKIK